MPTGPLGAHEAKASWDRVHAAFPKRQKAWLAEVGQRTKTPRRRAGQAWMFVWESRGVRDRCPSWISDEK